MTKHQLRMGKASEKDLESLYDFFHCLEYVNDSPYALTKDNIKEEYEDGGDHLHLLLECFNDDNEFEYELFVQMSENFIGHRWRRVVSNCETLINNVCDPEKTYLDFNEEIKNAVSLKDVKQMCEDIYNKKETINNFTQYWEDKEKEILKEQEE